MDDAWTRGVSMCFWQLPNPRSIVSSCTTRMALLSREKEELMAFRRKQSNDVFIPMHKPGWREVGCCCGAVPRAAPAPRAGAHAAGALLSWNDGVAARQGVHA
jgi:hypothetical protein